MCKKRIILFVVEINQLLLRNCLHRSCIPEVSTWESIFLNLGRNTEKVQSVGL